MYWVKLPCSKIRRGTLDWEGILQGGGGGVGEGGSQGPGFRAREREKGVTAWFEGAGRRRKGEREWSRVYAASLTLSTNADFKHPSAEAVAGRHAEAFVGGIFLGAHEDVVGGRKAVRLDAFHLHVLHIGKMDGPDQQRKKKYWLSFRSDNFILMIKKKSAVGK